MSIASGNRAKKPVICGPDAVATPLAAAATYE